MLNATNELKSAAAIALLTLSYQANAASCSAKNDIGDTCSVDCDIGQTASCSNATGASTPTCECKDSSLLFSKFSSGTDTIDPLTSINAKLTSLRAYKLRNDCQDVIVGQQCHHDDTSPSRFASETNGEVPLFVRGTSTTCVQIHEQRCTVVSGKLTVNSPLKIEKDPDVTVNPPDWKGIPDDYFGYRETYINCTSDKQTETFNHAETLKLGSKVIKTKTVNVGSAVSVKVTFSFVVDAETSAAFNHSVSITDTTEEDLEDTKTLSWTANLSIKPYVKVVMLHSWTRRSVPVTYSGSVLLDASTGPNLEGVSLISQVLPASDRTFPFSGVVSTARLYEGVTSPNETPLSRQFCAKSAGFSVLREVVKQ